MATVTHVTLTDDLDRVSQADETVDYNFGNVHYEIDLTTENATGLRNVFQQYAQSARAVSVSQTPAPVGRKQKAVRKAKKYDAKDVRAWAKAQGYEVSDRGRLHDEILAKYLEAHNLV